MPLNFNFKNKSLKILMHNFLFQSNYLFKVCSNLSFLLEISGSILNIYFLSRVLCFLYSGMVNQQIFLSYSVIRHAQDLGHKQSLGIVMPPGPVPVRVSDMTSEGLVEAGYVR